MSFKDYFNNANYVCATENYYFPYIRKAFFLNDKIKTAKLYISVLGFCEIYLNGKKITDDLFVTPLSAYNRQLPQDMNEGMEKDPFFGDSLSYTIYVSEFNIKRFLRRGKNAIGIVVSGGWYRSGEDKYGGFRNYGKTKACFQITAEDENGKITRIVSDGTCKWFRSFLTQGGVFHEEQDERLEQKDFSSPFFDDSAWNNVEICDTPDAKFFLNTCPPDKIIRWIKPVLIKDTGGKKVYDVGQNITGFPVIEGKIAPGDKIICIYSEKLLEDGNLDEFHSYKQFSSFISDGRKEHKIRFTWHGFRYFSITSTGNISDLSVKKCALVYADIKNVSHFECSDNVINFIYNTYIRTQLENYHCGVPTDCPQIERKGYTGDGQLLCELGMTLFDSRKLYEKWMQDISDVQDRNTGFVHNTAPCFVGCSGGPGGWGSAIINVPYTFYKIYGDVSVLDKYYDQMKLFLQFMDEESIHGLVCLHKRRGFFLGDWSGPEKPYLPEDFVNSCLYAEALSKMTEIAELCGRGNDFEKFKSRTDELKRAIEKKYFEKETGNYCNNKQGANAFALNIGLGDSRTIANLVEKYEKIGHFDTGIFGTKILLKVLFELGYSGVALSLYTSEHPVSFYSWMKDDATTLYESWINPRSLNHPMFGSVVLYLFEYILGIRQKSGAGYKKTVINPTAVKVLSRAEGSIVTCAGKFSVRYERSVNGISFIIEVPENVDCTFELGDVRKKMKSGVNEFFIDLKEKYDTVVGEKIIYEKTF